MIPISLSKQILPGTFEYTLNQLIKDQLDLSIFKERYKNDDTGAPAYDPAILLKIILFAYSKGIVSSRNIEKLCRENIICIALTADTHPHFTTIADFISSMGTECIELFTKILAICYSENLIGKNMFAIDGCKISSNCSKEWSGTKKELLNKSEKIKAAMEYLVSKHKQADASLVEDDQIKSEKESIQKLKEKADKITSWLDTHEEKLGASKQPKKSNIPDNESVKMSSSHCVIQGYNGIAAVDDKHQLIVYLKNKRTGCTGKAYMGRVKYCTNCTLWDKCLRKETTRCRQVVIFDKYSSYGNEYSNLMKDRFDTPYARSVYSKRMGTVEPVFGHIAGTKKLNRFTLRSKKKVNNQWLLYCMVHNIGKIQRYGKQ